MAFDSFVAVLDFGSQTTNLIARRVRDLGVNSKVLPSSICAHTLAHESPMAIILSGGPDSLTEAMAIKLDEKIFSLGIPILGICYGMQLIVEQFGGSLKRAQAGEFGRKVVKLDSNSVLFSRLKSENLVWMSHFDEAHTLGDGFRTIASSDNCGTVAIECPHKNIYGVQFHPEVSHTENGHMIFENFLFTIARAEKNYRLTDIALNKIELIKNQVGTSDVLMGLSGGVDSSVAAVLIHRAIGQRLHCVYVNHGLHRQGEIEEVKNLFTKILNINLHIVDAQDLFLTALAGVIDPEEKRKKIGHVFIEVFEKEARRFKNITFLAQGTLYSDVIESAGQKNGPAQVIKSHHNVGGLPERIHLKLLEPLRDLFKDEVRQLGTILGLDDHVIMRQPFPGPGLSVRIPGEVTKERLEILRKADLIVTEEIARAHKNGDILEKMWQWFAILLPVKSVGVMGDARSYGETIVIRCVTSSDAMTADWAKIPHKLLGVMSSRITNEVSGISRVLYDITQKPPGTIEWE